MVTFAEVIAIIIVLLLFGGVTFLSEVLESASLGWIVYLLDFAYIAISIYAIFGEKMRDFLYDNLKHMAAGIIAHIVYMLTLSFVYFKFILQLNGIVHILLSFILFMLPLGILLLSYFIVQKINSSNSKKIRYRTLIKIIPLSVLLPSMFVICYSIGFTATKINVLKEENIAYYIFDSQYGYIYEETEPFKKIGLKRDLPLVKEISRGCKLFPAENKNNQQLNYYYKTFWLGNDKCISYIAVETETGDFGYIESSDYTIKTFYFSPEDDPQILESICNYVGYNYHLPKFASIICYKLYRLFDFNLIPYAQTMV